MSCWIHLGIEPTKDNDVIRGAYRARLPQHHPETDPEGFQALREAYERALRFAREQPTEADEPVDDEVSPADQTLADFEALLIDPARRFSPAAWQAFNLELDRLPLEVLDDVCWPLLRELLDAGPISHACARLLAQRLGWASRMLDLAFDNARHVDEFLKRIAAPDPFDTSLMCHWPVVAQLEALWYVRTLNHLHHNASLDDFRYFASLHTCIPLPADDALVQRLAIQFSQAGIASKDFLDIVSEQHRLAPEDVDWLYLLACQRSALGMEELALQAWVQLWREHQHPKAATWLLDLCARHQPQRLPLLIQAFDRLENFRAWSADLSDVTQEYGSPSQRPETLGRWFRARQLDLQGIADAFVEWRISGDELPLLAWLIIASDDPALQTLYQHAWALHRGDVPLLQRVMDAPATPEVLDQLVLEGFKYQADQQICWLTQAPIPRALQAFLSSEESAQLPPELQKGEPLELSLLWMRRLRAYDARSLARLDEAFSLDKRDVVLDGLKLQAQLAEQGMLLPAIDNPEAVWEWHRQALYLLAILDEPTRWLGAQSAHCIDSMSVAREHPLARLQPLLCRLNREQGSASGLLGWLQAADPVHALLARKLFSVQEALDSTRLLSNDRLYECMRSDISRFNDDLLGRMLLGGVLYHDPLLNAQQRKFLLESITEVVNPQDWFDGFRHSLIKGEPTRPPREVLEDDGVDYTNAFYLALDVLKDLARYGSAGVPRQKILMRMQQAKDDTHNGLGLRFAFSALLSWSERLLLAKADTRPTPATAFWRLGTRLGREAFIGQVIGIVLLTPLLALFSGSMFSAFVVLAAALMLMLSAILRRLHDMGRGVATFLVLAGLTPVLPFLPLVLFGFPGEKLPNRYGVPPDSDREDTLSGGLQAALRRLNG
ncbi:uncharacterized membrane protein YhaH (DUF805 family) [Pseudomonas baetica]|uniref:Uncharacterized membrane protein YhaH (DUF805 family) n=1 Tax=Pseudomonas baetica TaxID=674054 RepID=A0ABX4PVG0_9PSED|nr:DUF805 domain-containing protein [Pseudomonas baetica]PKA68040.1 uncharacterized membrane protein YhaH (DUF805 family) [Pseudomonas baetica]PTC18081.1 molecular chaperone DnaJ [Pseudomonas baetica]